MSKSVNQVTLLGRLTKDPETKTTTTGKNVTSFTLAVDKFGSQEGTDFFDVNAWEKTGDLVSKYVSKGSKLLVTGRLQQQTWEQDGQKRSRILVVAFDVVFLDAKPETTPPEKSTSSPAKDEPINLDDIPF